MEKKRLTSKAWLALFLATALLVAAFVPAFNFIVDPYGAFGDRVLQWWSYDETLNPRMAKFRYLEQHHDRYDSYIIGSSGASCYPVEALNEYLDASFYNCFVYGTETETFEALSRWLIEHYEVKNLVLNASVWMALSVHAAENELTNYNPWQLSGESALLQTLRYLFASPLDSLKKLELRAEDGYLQESYKVFLPDTGGYDKSRRDAEPIGELAEYLARPAYAGFAGFGASGQGLPGLDEAMACIARIKALCDENGVNLLVICEPYYYKNLGQYAPEALERFYNALAQITDYWDFSLTSASWDERYFYDETHARLALGQMVLARIFGAQDVYVPEDFGRFVRQGETPGLPSAAPLAPEDYTVQLPILCYHHLVEEGECNSVTVTVGSFAAQMAALAEAGYTPVSIGQVLDYVQRGIPLPERPVMITFDDGYESNYTLAYPILRQYGFRATMFVIGVSLGKDTYKDTGVCMTPHFSLEQAAEMEASGLITVASHGYDVHEVAGRDAEPLRSGVLQREGESEEDYVAFLTADARQMFELLGEDAGFFAYPNGLRDERARVILRGAGVYATVLAEGTRANVLIKGLPQCLYDLQRLHVYDDTTPQALLALLDAAVS